MTRALILLIAVGVVIVTVHFAGIGSAPPSGTWGWR